jgi:uncharacterized protein DUF1761
MDLSHINWAATIVAALAGFMVGPIWYSKALFWNAWLASANLTPAQIETRNKGKVFGFGLVFSLFMAATLAMFLTNPKTDIVWGAEAGFLTGIWTFSAIAISSLFELKSWKYIFINGGYSVISLTVMGAVLGAWR